MKQKSIIGVVGLTLLVAASLPAHARAVGTQEKVTVVGCAVKGDGDVDGFLLVNSVNQTTTVTTTPTPVGAIVGATTSTELGATRVVFWLDDDDDEVQRLMGQLVEVTGEIEGDIQRGEIKAEREDGMIELEINAGGRKATVKLPDVPSAIGSSRSVPDREVDLPYLVRKLDVKSAKSVAATCKQ
jgi:hypothetical protein